MMTQCVALIQYIQQSADFICFNKTIFNLKMHFCIFYRSVTVIYISNLELTYLLNGTYTN